MPVKETSVVITQATAKAPTIVQLIGFVLIVMGVVSCIGGDVRNGVRLLMLGPLIWLVGRFWGWEVRSRRGGSGGDEIFEAEQIATRRHAVGGALGLSQWLHRVFR
jgi:hypothetical protein